VTRLKEAICHQPPPEPEAAERMAADPAHHRLAAQLAEDA
jgi:hypothetical protein